jgi:exodeoxyribonuclease V gamma subunit
MIRLYYANRLESLIEPLAQAVSKQQAEHPLETVVIVLPDSFVPSRFGDLLEPYRAIEQFVRFRLAERMGVAANLDFPSLRSFLAGIVERSNPNLSVLSRQDLQLVVFECLRSPALKDEPELSTLRDAAMLGVADESEIEKRTFELAAKLGHLFYEYATGCQAMLRKWRAGLLLTREPYRRIERSQRRLYLSIFGPDGALQSTWAAERNRRCMLFPDALEALEPSSVRAVLPPVFHFFGALDADPILPRALRLLSTAADFQVYALNPCREFWEDITNAQYASPKAEAATAQLNLDTDTTGANDRAELHFGRDCVALRLWARSGRELTRMLNELSAYDFEEHFTSATDDSQKTLLGSLQDDVLNREPERFPVSDDQPEPNSASIRFLACPGVRREVETVADAIWSLLQENNAAASQDSRPIRFHEIALLIPDSQRDIYLPHIEGLFEQRYRLPLNVVNRPLTSQSRVAEAIELLLDLPLSRFTRDEVIRLLTHPAIVGTSEKADAQRWRQWCEELNVVFGADARDFADSYIPRDVYHWDQALRRLSLGVFMAGERSGKTELFHTRDGDTYLPFDVDQDESKSVARLVCSARGLLGSALELKNAHLNLDDWLDILIKLVKSYVRVADSADERVLDCYLRGLESIVSSRVAVGAVSYDVVRRLIRRRLAAIEAAHGQLSYTGVVVGPLSVLCALPFRVIFLLGLGAALFPERERPDWHNLPRDGQEREDLTLTERQRYWFLQTLLAARENLFLSYNSVDPQTGDPLEPSVVVHELQSILRGYVSQSTLAQMTISAPSSRYDLECFPHLQALALQPANRADDLSCKAAAHSPETLSFDIDARRGASMNALRRNLDHHCAGVAVLEGAAVLGLLPEQQRDRLTRSLQLPKAWLAKAPPFELRSPVSLPLAALRRFLECPIQGTALYAVGILDDDLSEVGEDELLAQSRLQRVELLRRAFWQGQGDFNAMRRAYLEAFRMEQARGRAPFGPFARVQQQDDLAVLHGWLRLAQEAGLGDFARWQDIVIGHTDAFAEAASRILPAIRFDLPCRAIDSRAAPQPGDPPMCISVSLHGRLSRLSPALNCALHLVVGDKAAPKDFLRPALSALALRAAGVLDRDSFEAVVIAVSAEDRRQISRKTLSLPAAEAIVTYLTDLTDDLLSGYSDYFLPIEAVDAVLSHQRSPRLKRRGSLHDIILRVRDDRNQPVSSAYGPVRNARRFSPPESDDEVEKIIERRFGLLDRIFS